jgi:hypothetical protein
MSRTDEIIGLRAAAEIAGVSHETVRFWVDKHGIGEKRGDTFIISRSKLMSVKRSRQKLRSAWFT